MDGPLRFSEISQAVPELSSRLLSQRLKELEVRGIVERTVHPTSPIRVDYQLSQTGRELEPALSELQRWAARWLGRRAELASSSAEEGGEADALSAQSAAFAPHPVEPTLPMVLQDRRNAEARREMLMEFAGSGTKAGTRPGLLEEWSSALRIFGVSIGDEILYPRFQFAEDGEPKLVVERVLTTLPIDQMSPWELALWWAAGNGWLDGQRPVDLMDTDPDAVVSAAAHLAEPSPL
jgi:DNA-binding HxlR family transcriptional regulator